MKTRVIFCSLVNPYRKHSNGGSEDVRRRIEAIASVADSVTVFAIDYQEELLDPESLPDNVRLHLYKRTIDPRPWRWNYPLACVRRYNHHMVADIRKEVTQCSGPMTIFVEGMQLFGLWFDIKSTIPKDTKVILRVHNIESAYHYSVASESRGLLKLAHRLSSLQYRTLENKLLRDFTFLYAVSEKEEEALIKRYGISAEKIHLITPIPLDKPCRMSEKSVGRPFILSYFGDLTLPNNYSGLYWFCDNVLPKLNDDIIELHIAGKGSDRFSVYDRVRVHGFVKEIDAFVCQSHIIVAPIFSGAGVKIKVLDTIGYGKPMVTTPKGAEGLPEWLVNRLYITPDANEFVDYLNLIFSSYSDIAQESVALQKELSRRLGVPMFQRQFLEDNKVL
jgi:hypothetical protein